MSSSITLFRTDNIKESMPELIEVFETSNLFNDRSVYLIDRPLLLKNEYSCDNCFVVLIPGYKIFLSTTSDAENLPDFHEDFIDDLNALSQNYGYSEVLGRKREWAHQYIYSTEGAINLNEVPRQIIENCVLESGREKRVSSLLVSLLIGCINNLDNINIDEPTDLLEAIRQRIILFDNDQTRFIYQRIPNKKRIIIQGLAGTGKTELLLHKLRSIYLSNEKGHKNRIFFTCFNKILADSMLKRIPEFFNLMKVNEQIEWNTRLHVASSWGSYSDPNSGFYRFVCHSYDLPFHNYGEMHDFDAVCKTALNDLPKDASPCLDYVFIDESQDFPDSFFELCERVTSETIFIAGDIFQDIFDYNDNNTIEADYLLNRCYRTDPKTLLFAHALGFGLCEEPVIRWLSDEEWNSCGYTLKRNNNKHTVSISRRPLNRFGDIDTQNTREAINIFLAEDIPTCIIDHIKELQTAYPSLRPSDIAIVFPGKGKVNYSLADIISDLLFNELEWESVKGYESKYIDPDKVLISNRNNIKGLEFPFIICYVPGELTSSTKLRNALYMILTRSFISSTLIAPKAHSEVLKDYKNIAITLKTDNCIEVREPTEEEKKKQDEILSKSSTIARSLFELIDEVLREKQVNESEIADMRKSISNFLSSSINDYDDEEAIRMRIEKAYQAII